MIENMSLRHFRRKLNEQTSNSIKTIVEKVNPLKEVCIPTMSTSLLPNIEEHNIVIPIGLSVKNIMHFNNKPQLVTTCKFKFSSFRR